MQLNKKIIRSDCAFNWQCFSFYFVCSDAEEELNKLAELADRINSQIGADESFVSNSSQNVDLDQLFNFLSQVHNEILAMGFLGLESDQINDLLLCGCFWGKQFVYCSYQVLLLVQTTPIPH